MKISIRFLRKRKNKRRLKKEKLPQRPYFESLKTFQQLIGEIDSFDGPVRKRLLKIEKHWEKFTTFYFVEGAPATSNILKNYYSTSLKTHRKKQEPTEV